MRFATKLVIGSLILSAVVPALAVAGERDGPPVRPILRADVGERGGSAAAGAATPAGVAVVFVSGGCFKDRAGNEFCRLGANGFGEGDAGRGSAGASVMKGPRFIAAGIGGGGAGTDGKRSGGEAGAFLADFNGDGKPDAGGAHVFTPFTGGQRVPLPTLP